MLQHVSEFPLDFIFHEKTTVSCLCGGELQPPWQEVLSSPSALGRCRGPRGRRPWDGSALGAACLLISHLESWKGAFY